MKYYIERARILEPGEMQMSDHFLITHQKQTNKPHWSKPVAIDEQELDWLCSAIHEYESAQRRLRDLYYKSCPNLETVDG